MIHQDTIVALATPSGSGAIAVIRLSGNNAIQIAEKLFSATKKKDLHKQKSRTVLLGNIKDGDVVIDEVLLSIFKNPNSYTGEDVVEISCHGSSFIIKKIIFLLLSKGCRMAMPGEFTRRAFAHGKLNLVQAEAVASLIASETKYEHQIALQQMRGGFSSKLQKLREQLIHFKSLIELELDFSEEDVEFANYETFQQLIKEITSEVQNLLDSFAYGNAIKEGLSVVIAGKPNAGKSTLLNALLQEERAIVTPVAGTTRDTLEELIVMKGYKFRFIDTAGLRETEDMVEAIGIQKAKTAIQKAKILIYLFDLQNTTPKEVLQSVEQYQREGLQIILCQTHIDIHRDRFQEAYAKIANNSGANKFFIGQLGLKGATVEPSITWLKTTLIEILDSLKPAETAIIVSSMRHQEALKNAQQSLQQVKEGLENNLSGDLLSVDLQEAQYCIGQITGEIDIDADILGTIFGKFCIGK